MFCKVEQSNVKSLLQVFRRKEKQQQAGVEHLFNWTLEPVRFNRGRGSNRAIQGPRYPLSLSCKAPRSDAEAAMQKRRGRPNASTRKTVMSTILGENLPSAPGLGRILWDVPNGAGWRMCPPIIGTVENTNIFNQFLKLSTVHPHPQCQKRGRGREGGRELRKEKISTSVTPMSSLAYQQRKFSTLPNSHPL